MKPMVVYGRVSTQKQGDSGLGLEAQQHAVDAYVKQNDGHVLRRQEKVSGPFFA